MLMVFHQTGKVEFTRNPKMLAVAAGTGPVRIDRMSEIKFDAMVQRYYIQFCTGYFKDFVLRWRGGGLAKGDELSALWNDFYCEHSRELVNEHTDRQTSLFGPVFFYDYEGAVAIEVAFIDMLRERGIAVQ